MTDRQPSDEFGLPTVPRLSRRALVIAGAVAAVVVLAFVVFAKLGDRPKTASLTAQQKAWDACRMIDEHAIEAALGLKVDHTAPDPASGTRRCFVFFKSAKHPQLNLLINRGGGPNTFEASGTGTSVPHSGFAKAIWGESSNALVVLTSDDDVFTMSLVGFALPKDQLEKKAITIGDSVVARLRDNPLPK